MGESDYELNFLYSSVIFLQSYMPIVAEARSRGVVYRFFIRRNGKKYADPTIREKEWRGLLKKFVVEPMKNLRKYQQSSKKQVIICVDGDNSGPVAKFGKDSGLYMIDRSKFFIVSLLENFNFLDSYKEYKKLVDRVIVQNQHHINYYGFIKGQAVPLGLTKFDWDFGDRVANCKKYKLDVRAKYVLVFYPRFDRGRRKFGEDFGELYLAMLKWLRDMGYRVIVKNREKLKLVDRKFGGDHYFTDGGQWFPNVSLELMRVVDFAVFFGSSVIEELVMMRVPFVEFILDGSDRFSFLRGKYSVTYGKVGVEMEQFPERESFERNVKELLDRRDRDGFDKMIGRYLFEGRGSSIRLLDSIGEWLGVKC